MLAKLLKHNHWGITILRVVLGITFFLHGVKKFMDLKTEIWWFVPVAFFETLSGALLILGFLTRYAAIPPAVIMVSAFFMVHRPNGFFIFNNGYEYVMVLFFALVALILLGPGKLSLEEKIFKKEL